MVCELPLSHILLIQTHPSIFTVMIFKLLRVIGFKISGAVKVEGCGQPQLTAVVDSYTVQCTTIYGTLQFKIHYDCIVVYCILY